MVFFNPLTTNFLGISRAVRNFNHGAGETRHLILFGIMLRGLRTYVLLKEKERRGKSVAINEILKSAKERLIVVARVVDGDVIPAKDAIINLLSPWEEMNVGAPCGQVVPLTIEAKPLGFWAHFSCWAARVF